MEKATNLYLFGNIGNKSYNSGNREVEIKQEETDRKGQIVIIGSKIGVSNNIKKTGENEYVEKLTNGLSLKYKYINDGEDLEIEWKYEKPENKKKDLKVEVSNDEKQTDGINQNNTATEILEKVKIAMKKLNYELYNKPYILNIVGIRSKTRVANRFDDKLIVFYNDKNQKEISKVYDRFTTDPGNKSLLKWNSKEKGCAILKNGQYKDTWIIGKHKGQYTALKQNGYVYVYRDSNKDFKLNTDNKTIEKRNDTGINIHHASFSGTSSYVENWSAGCQVFANIKDFNEVMKLVYTQRDKGNKSKFTYTLLLEEEI